MKLIWKRECLTKPKLSDKEIEILTKWIDQGANGELIGHILHPKNKKFLKFLIHSTN